MKPTALFLLFLASGSGSLAAQPAELLAVDRWRMEFSITAEKSFKSDEADWSYRMSAVGSALLERRPDTRDEWDGHMEGQISLKLTGTTKTGCPIVQTLEYTGPPRRFEEADSNLYASAEGFFVSTGNPHVDATLTTEWLCPGMEGKQVITEQFNWGSNWPAIPYPAGGLELAGSVTMSDLRPGIVAAGLYAEPIDHVLEVVLYPDGFEQVRLEIEPADGFDRWRPSAAADGSDGEPVAFTATLRTADGSPPSQKMQTLEWELRETSREPGITINWPRQPAGNEPDLYFPPQQAVAAGASREPVGDGGQKVVVTFDEGGLSDRIEVHPRDWGAWSTLHATAVLENKRRVVGRRQGSAEVGVRLPDRDPGRFIARTWLQDRGITADDRSDLDDRPQGDAHPGDGLTLYEEYRGFHVDGQRVEGDPERKELFVVNEGATPFSIGSASGTAGIAHFQRITGVRVHGKLSRSEMDDERVVNHNFSASPRLGPQHAVLIKVDPALVGEAKAFTPDERPKTPAGVRYIGLPVSFPQRDTASPAVSYDTITVAHELLHAVNVYHHGESDEVVFWSRDPDGKMYEQATVEQDEQYVPVGPRSEIRAFLEDGRDVTSQTRVGLRHLGRQHGQHSGAENCVMRYDLADSYVWLANPAHRYVGIKEIQGTGLDNTREGSDVNLLTRLPQSRYGAAAPERGNCAAQILVSDAVKPPER